MSFPLPKTKVIGEFALFICCNLNVELNVYIRL